MLRGLAFRCGPPRGARQGDSGTPAQLDVGKAANGGYRGGTDAEQRDAAEGVELEDALVRSDG